MVLGNRGRTEGGATDAANGLKAFVVEPLMPGFTRGGGEGFAAFIDAAGNLWFWWHFNFLFDFLFGLLKGKFGVFEQ